MEDGSEGDKVLRYLWSERDDNDILSLQFSLFSGFWTGQQP